MGVEGWITLYDDDQVDEYGVTTRMFEHFENVYQRTLFGHRIYHVYEDTEGHDLFKWEAEEDRSRTRTLQNILNHCLLDKWEVCT